MIKLGNRVKDSITGFTGIATARSQFITGCDQISITPENHKGTDPKWFDEGRIVFVDHGINTDTIQAEKKGGPQSVPQKG
jgi:hypothetical protein